MARLVHQARSQKRSGEPVHPGEVLRQMLADAGCSISDAARLLSMSRSAVSLLCSGLKQCSPLMAHRLAALFRTTTPEYWMELQTAVDLWTARAEFDELASKPRGLKRRRRSRKRIVQSV